MSSNTFHDINIHLHACSRVLECRFSQLPMCTYIHIHTHIYTHENTSKRLYMYMYAYICMYVCMYMHLYVYILIHKKAHSRLFQPTVVYANVYVHMNSFGETHACTITRKCMFFLCASTFLMVQNCFSKSENELNAELGMSVCKCVYVCLHVCTRDECRVGNVCVQVYVYVFVCMHTR